MYTVAANYMTDTFDTLSMDVHVDSSDVYYDREVRVTRNKSVVRLSWFIVNGKLESRHDYFMLEL
jgi:hypothetical protein